MALLLTIAGSTVVDVYNTLDFGAPTEAVPEPDKVFTTVVTAVDNYFAPRKNKVYARYLVRCSK